MTHIADTHMEGESKKQSERRIFDMVYGDVSLAEVMGNECPDFLVRLFDASPYFGVEVTEYYQSESNARLDHIRGYSHRLLRGEDFEHRDDRETLEVAKVDIVREDDSFHAKDVPAIIQRVPPPSECARQIAQRIQTKTQQIQNSAADTTHANLIIQDRTGLLRVTKVADFYRIYFGPELISQLSATSFREVFLITDIDGRSVYARLKMLLLLADTYLFNGALASNGIAARLPTDVDAIELFASYFASTVDGTVLVHHNKDGTEVIFGDSGVMVGQDGSVTVRLHTDRPIHPKAKPPALQWEALLGSDFRDFMIEYRKSNTFSSDVLFPINKAE